MQAIVVDHANRDRHARSLELFFRARHRIYAEKLRWVPCSPDGLERDQFDTPEATYILILEDDRLVAGSRLIATSQPHLASEIFASAFNRRALPRDPQVLEWTRGFIIPDRRGKLKLMAFSCAAVMEYCLLHGFRQVGGMQDLRWLKQWERWGWRVEIYGDPLPMDSHLWLPAYCDVTEHALQRARYLAGLTPGVAAA
jgi:acyl-homoserine lactone synthase